jgi:hypothetical protein
MGKKSKSKMGAVPSSYYEMNVDQVAVEEEEKPQDDALTDIKGNVVYRVSYADAVKSILEEARSIQVQSIGEEIPKDEASLGVIDLSASVVEPADDDALSQKQKQQKGSYWFWWRK